MSQKGELDRVKARIKALAEKTVSNGCTEAEAMAAAEMVGRLLERYALSMDEIEVREARCVQIMVPIGGQRRRPIDGCVPAIARLCDCKVWLACGGTDAITKTLAKVANHRAKKDPACQGVCVMLDESAIDAELSRLPLTDIWGIAGRLAGSVTSRAVLLQSVRCELS